MKRAILFIIIGLILCFSALWIGSYYCVKLAGTWAGFPTFMTSTIVFVTGVVVSVLGMATLLNNIEED